MTESYIVNLFGALGIRVSDVLRGLTQDSDAADSDMAALCSVLAHPDETIDVLARALQLTHSGAVRLTDRLEDAGLLRRIAQGRTVRLRLSAKGESAARAWLEQRHKALANLLKSLSRDERRQLGVLLTKVLDGNPINRDQARQICRNCDESCCAASGCPVNRAVIADSK
jgi:DNA-binding MarR family transcriptional regulator